MDPSPPPLPPDATEVVVARPGELWLKGKNRGEFERALVHNVRRALEGFPGTRVERDYDQLIVWCERRPAEVARRLQDVFGLAALLPAWTVRPEPEEIAGAAHHVLSSALERLPRGRKVPFRVRTRRTDKSFPMISTELDLYVADRITPGYEDRLEVDLGDPELTIGIHLRAGRTFVHAERLRGAGGLPVGTLGRALCLLSGGIDSPVAAWMAMKRGCAVSFVSFHSSPYLGESSKRKIRLLAETLMRYQPRGCLYSVPFTEVQVRIRDSCPEAYRTVLYRRMMQRIAVRLARREKAGALVTGESLGQVASQTLENMTCIGAVSPLPVLRPLVCFDKQETIELAQRIGTYEISILREPDCCTVFRPRRPVIRGRIEACEEAEAELDVEELVETAAREAERTDLTA